MLVLSILATGASDREFWGEQIWLQGLYLGGAWVLVGREREAVKSGHTRLMKTVPETRVEYILQSFIYF